MGDHAFSKVAHDGLCLDVEVAEHGIRAPLAKELDDVVVDMRTEERHGSGGMEGAGGNVCRAEAKLWAQDGSSQLEHLGDLVGCKGLGPLWEVGGGQGSVGVGVIGSQMKYPFG